jgi:hypothetical protein
VKVTCDGDNGCGRTFVAKMREKKTVVVQANPTLKLTFGDLDPVGVVQYMQCPYCRQVFPIAHITDDGLALRKRIEKRRRQGKPADDELLAEYNRELTPLR